MFGYLDLHNARIEAIDAATITSIYPARGSTEGKLDPTHNLTSRSKLPFRTLCSILCMLRGRWNLSGNIRFRLYDAC